MFFLGYLVIDKVQELNYPKQLQAVTRLMLGQYVVACSHMAAWNNYITYKFSSCFTGFLLAYWYIHWV